MSWPIIITFAACGVGFLALLTLLTLSAGKRDSDGAEAEKLSRKALLGLGLLLMVSGFMAVYFLVEYALEDLGTYAG